MASLRFEQERGRRGWRLQFRDIEKRNRSIWLGDVRESVAQETKEHVEHLLDRVKKKRPPELPTADWLGEIGEELREKLARCGLAESREKRVARTLTLSAWIDEYIQEREDVKKATRDTYLKAKANLVDYFGQLRLIREITSTDAKKWRVWLKTEGNRRDANRKTMAEETVRRRTGTVKQFFREAVERGYITTNPFENLASTTQGNAKLQFFVESHVVEACMDHCPCVDWRTILALARYGGLRCPSELVSLRWSDVDLPGGKMIVNATKTEHHASGGVRACPIFPELRPYLEAAWDAAPEGAEFVINRYRDSSQNLRQTLLRILKHAGVTPWPRLFQNMRASRETELMARFPAKDVSSWLGNSVPVAMRHYAMATEASFLEACDPQGRTVSHRQDAVGAARGHHESREGGGNPESHENGGCIGGCISKLSGAIEPLSPNEETPVSQCKTGVFIVQDSSGNYYLMGDEGLEPPTFSV